MRLENYLVEEEIVTSLTYEDYCCVMDYVFSEEYTEEGLEHILSESFVGRLVGKVKDKAVEYFKRSFKAIKNELVSIMAEFKMGWKELVIAFKERNIWNFFNAIKFNIKGLIKSVAALGKFVRQGLFAIFNDLAKTKTFQKIQAGTMKVDEVMDRYPLLKKVTGIVVAGLLFYIWLNMTFIGDLDYDFNFTTLAAAFAGAYTLTELFASPDGLVLMTLFATGGLISVAWLGSTVGNLTLALVYTAFTHLRGRDLMIVDKLKKMKKKIKKGKK